ncbi:hypothetical protein G4B88_008169 [Cannabis sativa]|uniref:Aminotransferase-like plant mobile domain-containing protein n=1 Tax=Cannabis sativa TaxID=3483 RepID=A0A7J6I7H8_CANSA|nr:hypothetical protein G4B88_008169 [Cannabis sativa]
MGHKRKTVSLTLESTVSSDDAPPSRDELFSIIYEEDRVYLYQDSARDHIISGQDLPLRCHYEGNDFEIDYRSLSGAANGWKEWTTSVSIRFQEPLKSVSILSSMWVCTGIEIFFDVTILNQLASCWCHTTHTFLVNWVEFSVTLEDVYALLLLPICGITSASEPLSKDEKDLLSGLTEASNDLKKMMPRAVRRALYPLACKLARGKQLPIGAFYLGTLYHNLDSIVRDINSGSMKKISVVESSFLQLFIWEHFHKLAPPRKCLKDGSPRAWSRFCSRLKGSVQLTDIVDYISEFNFHPYLTNICAYFTLDMCDGSVVPLTSEVRSNLNISRGGIRFWFAICLPRWLLFLQDNSKSLSWSFISYCPDRVARKFGFDQHVPHDRKAGSLEKAPKSCLLGSLQVSKRSHDLFQLPCPTEGEDLTTETGAHITSQETQLVDPPGHGLVGERHVPSRSIPDDMMSTFLEGDQSVLANSSHDGAISGSIQTTIPVGPIPTIASFGTGGFLDFSKTSNLFSQDQEDISSRTPTMANIGQNSHKACPSAPTDNPLVIEHNQVESEYGKDLAALVGLDSECLAPLGPYTSQFCSLYASLDKDFTSFFENLSPIKKSLFIQLSSPCLPLLRLTFEISEQHYSHLEYWKILFLIFLERPSVLGKIVESYFEVVNSSIRYRHLVGELEKICEERDIKVREIEELNHKIVGSVTPVLGSKRVQ